MKPSNFIYQFNHEEYILIRTDECFMKEMFKKHAMGYYRKFKKVFLTIVIQQDFYILTYGSKEHGSGLYNGLYKNTTYIAEPTKLIRVKDFVYINSVIYLYLLCKFYKIPKCLIKNILKNNFKHMIVNNCYNYLFTVFDYQN